MDIFMIECGIFLLVALVGCPLRIAYVKKQKRVKIGQEQQARMKYKDIMPGDYLFPAEKFYEQCEKDGWNDIDNDIHIADNEANKSFNNLVTSVAWDKTYDAKKVLDASKERLQKYKDDLASLDTKIVFEEIPSEELCGKLIINAALNEQQNNMLEVSIRNNYCKKMDVTTVVDGTIQVKVFCDGNLLEEVCVALPCYGVRSRKTNVVKTFLHYKMIPGKANYSFETEPNFLWLMEE